MMQFYNVLFTALPCIVFAVFDKDVDDRISMEHPELYRLGVEDGIFTTRAMLSWMVSGVYHSSIIFFFGYYQFAFGGHAFESGLDGDVVQFGVLTFFALVIITNIRAGMIALTWTWLMPASLMISIGSFLFVAFLIGSFPFPYNALAHIIMPLTISTKMLLSCVHYCVFSFSRACSPPLTLVCSLPGAIGLHLGVLGGSFYLALASSMTSARFWLCGLVTIFAALLRDFSWRAYVRLHDPSEVTKRQAISCRALTVAMNRMICAYDGVDDSDDLRLTIPFR
jgi:magnesium-transporting ATPase (P-type)